MSEVILTITDPIYISVVAGDPNADILLELAEVYYIGIIEADAPGFEAWRLGMFTAGIKRTGVDAGLLGQVSITDDYRYECVQGGVAGLAIWKKSLLFQSG